MIDWLHKLQVIVNKSRAQWRAMVTTVPFQIEDFNMIIKISDDVKSMLKSNPNVFLEKEAPYCYLSKIEKSFAELTLGCNLRYAVCLLFFSLSYYHCEIHLIYVLELYVYCNN